MAKKKKQEETYVAIRLSSSKMEYKPSSRYLLWINDNWYETTTSPVFVFPESQLPVIKKQLQQHYLYHVEFVNKDGSTTMWNRFSEVKKVTPKVKFKPFNGITFVLRQKT